MAAVHGNQQSGGWPGRVDERPYSLTIDICEMGAERSGRAKKTYYSRPATFIIFFFLDVEFFKR